MKLYVKTWCGWCIEAVEWLRTRGYPFEQIDVLTDRAAYDHMIRISGQKRTPTLELPSGEVLADFDVRQLEKFFQENSITAE
jgi:glutaredoxin 3